MPHLTQSLDILVTPERPAKCLINLTAAEISDLAQITQTALKVLMHHYNPEMCQVAIQDGPAAGQTISVSIIQFDKRIQSKPWM